MTTKEEWIKQMVAQDACDPAKGDHRVNTAYSGEYLRQFEVIDVSWAVNPVLLDEDQAEQERKYSKARNSFARQLRKDNWTIRCESYTNMWDQRVIKLSGERPKVAGGQTTLGV